MSEGTVDREMILASAGSGKTHRLSSRLIGLLVLGTPPAEILASTFTKKAAGEILDRVLIRLAEGALDEEGARKLRESMPPGIPADTLTRARCGEILLGAVGELHRLRVQTLDAFFHTIIRSFALELDLAEGWTIADEADGDRLRSQAVEGALGRLDPGVLLEMVRMLSRGGAGREVHALLLREVEKLHTIYREADPEAEALWGFAGFEGESGSGAGGGASGGDGSSKSGPVGEDDAEAVEALLSVLRAIELPRTAKGAINSPWQNAMGRTLAAVSERRWRDLLESGFGAAILEGKGSYSRLAIPPEIQAAYDTIFCMAVCAIGAEFHRRMQALGRFLPAYDSALRQLAREEGLQGFSDLTDLLATRSAAGDENFLVKREEVYYRLDGRIRHVLLDEFQDTSNSQWRALEPLAGEILSGGEDGRSVFIVADPKQSIYGWRGGEPGIFDRISRGYGITPGSMAKNWRSSQVVLDAVNRIFTGLSSNPALAGNEAIAEEWERAFELHTAGRPELPGHVRLEVGPAIERRGGSTFFPQMLEYAASRVRDLHRDVPGATIAVLTRTNRNAEYIIAHLRLMGIEASGEGGVPVADSAPVLAVLALLRMADHPGDTISRYLVARTPLGAEVGLGPEEWRSDGRAEEVARQLRRRLVEEGYGRVLRDWAEAIAPAISQRDALRMRQMVELGYRWEGRASLRPTDFVRMVERVRMEDPASARIRVMTVHRAKGLEFDAVILPDLDGLSLSGEGRDPFLALRSDEDGSISGVFPAIPTALRPLFFGEVPEVVAAFPGIDFERVARASRQARERVLRDGLSALYVGVTRPRYALLLLVGAEAEKRKKEKVEGKIVRTGGELLRNSLAPAPPTEGEENQGDRIEGGEAQGGEAEGKVLFEVGSPEWWKDPSLPSSIRGEVGHREQLRGRVRRTIPMAALPRRRLLPLRSPSELEGEGRVHLERLLLFGVGQEEGALRRGTLIHAWMAEIEWLESTGIPSHERLRAIAAEESPELGEATREIVAFEGWLAHPEIQRLLSRDAFPSGTEVERERPFLARDGERILRGIADRILRIPDPEGERLLVLDWKSDRVDPADPESLAAKLAFYAPQVRAYMRGLSASEGIPLARVEGVLVFLGAGIVQRITDP